MRASVDPASVIAATDLFFERCEMLAIRFLCHSIVVHVTDVQPEFLTRVSSHGSVSLKHVLDKVVDAVVNIVRNELEQTRLYHIDADKDLALQVWLFLEIGNWWYQLPQVTSRCRVLGYGRLPEDTR